MSGLIVDTELCVGCGRCVRACATGGIVVEGPRGKRKARPTDSCVLCGSCVDACPVDAISIEHAAATGAAEDLSIYRDIWVFCQVDERGAVLPVAFELLGKGRELADARGCDLVAVYLHAPLVPLERQSLRNEDRLVAAGADRVIASQSPRFAEPEVDAFAVQLCALVEMYRPEAILYGATAFGRELAPAVAVRLGTGLTADCTVLGIDAETGLLLQTRPAFGGNLMATIECPAHRPQMATVRPGVFPVPVIPTGDELPDVRFTGKVTAVGAAHLPEQRVRVLARDASGSADSITDADVLVVVGRGIGSKKNLPVAERLAELLGGKVGCTRPIVEAGWLEAWHQVGQTGVSVAPNLLISLGASGAIQHLAGIGGAETVIAVNEDPGAPIFDAARFRVEGDCVAVAREMIARLEARQKA